MPRELAHLSDEAVVALVSRSDEAALGELYDRFSGVAYALARRIVRDPDLAEDVVQESFLSVWRGAGRFVPERARASGWLLTLVHRRAVDLVRREQRRRADPLDEASMLTGRERSAEDAAWLRLERERVQDALARLPDQQRELLELAYFGGFTQSQLAERLGRPLGTIKSQMFAGLAQLRELLEPDSQEESWTTS
ncbi:MAG: sigma-70 family RNA polymerase sigma factor [Acidobacteriota bacterium]|nr:sigma-70 family RNA polymerase sigma factor [Acidobacteriota bacterium]